MIQQAILTSPQNIGSSILLFHCGGLPLRCSLKKLFVKMERIQHPYHRAILVVTLLINKISHSLLPQTKREWKKHDTSDCESPSVFHKAFFRLYPTDCK